MHKDFKKIEVIREMASSGSPATAIAEALKISRARVYQIASAEKIRFDKRYRQQVPSVPRVITGGVPCDVNNGVVGTISELLVAADLLARGWEVYLSITRSRGHDAIAIKNERIVTIEVRSACRNRYGSLSFNRTSRDRSQVYALVVSGEPVIYKPDIDDPNAPPLPPKVKRRR
jgi:hypothetical protein